jgi:hypothetical protein
VTFKLGKGACFLAPSGPSDLMHLHVVITDVDKDGFHLVAAVNSIRPNRSSDKACEFTGDGTEHDFIKHPSFIQYGVTTTMRASHIEAMIEKSYYKPKENIPDKECERIEEID